MTTRPERHHFQDLSPTALHVISDGLWSCDDDEFEQAEVYFLDLRDTWRMVRDELLSEWSHERPGTRPSYWWTYDSPEPRACVGGKGTTIHERYAAHAESLVLGIPDDWHSIDPQDPPQFESQASYLKRHGLFLHGEERRLTARDFEPAVRIE